MKIDGDSAWAYDGGQEPCEAGKEFLDSQSQNIIKLVLTLIQKSISVHPTKKCFTFKNTMRYGSKHTGPSTTPFYIGAHTLLKASTQHPNVPSHTDALAS